MSRAICQLQLAFVELVPERPEPGTLYVTMKYATAVHLCCCGCGHEVVTPFSPTDWRLIFDGETVSLEPSIGNWSFPCRSHYWIRHNEARWAEAWSDERVAAQGRRNQATKQSPSPAQATPPDVEVIPRGPWVRVWQWIKRMR